MQPGAPDPLRPALRACESRFVDDAGRRGVVLSDPLGLMAGEVFLPEGILPIVALLDGTRTVPELTAELTHGLGQAPPAEFLPSLLAQLDEHLLLHSPRFVAELTAAQRAFLTARARPPRHAGSPGYPAEPDRLRARMRELLPPPGAAAEAPPLRGLIAPHIDLARGAAGYGAAYGALAGRRAPDLFVLFGTGHHGPTAPVTGLPLDWDTPLGVVPTDREFVDAVERSLGPADPLDRFLHRDEHSLEFQMLFLRHLYPGPELRVAAFLTGAIPDCCEHHDSGHDPAYIAGLTAAMATAARGRTICFVAGADLAHLGPWFGDPAPVDADRLEILRLHEEDRLGHLLRGDPDGFHAAVLERGNPDRICGTTPIYLTAALAGGRGELLHYGQAVDPDGMQAVSFCSMQFC